MAGIRHFCYNLFTIQKHLNLYTVCLRSEFGTVRDFYAHYTGQGKNVYPKIMLFIECFAQNPSNKCAILQDLYIFFKILTKYSSKTEFLLFKSLHCLQFVNIFSPRNKIFLLKSAYFDAIL